MDIAAMNQRIQIQKSKVSVDKIGNRKNMWVDCYSCYATVSEETGQEKSTDFGVVENAYINFTVRYCKALEHLTATEYRVIFQGDIYNILGINHMNYKKKSLKIRCNRERGSI